MTPDRPLRILHAPADVGGHARGLALAERRLGHQSDVAVFSPGPFGYEADINLDAGADQPLPLRFARRGRFLSAALRRYDVFHFNFGQTLLQIRQFGHVVDELPLLRRLDKRVIVTFQGCDVRPFSHCFCRRQHCALMTGYRQLAADRAMRYADRVLYLNPDLGRWLSGAEFLPYASFDPYSVSPMEPVERDEVVVVHAPTDRAVKGTQHIVEAVAALQAERVPIRLTLLEDLPRERVLREMAEADIVVDQLLLGWYGGIAVEAMALGKPVVCAIDEDANPFGAELPIIRGGAGTVAGALRRLVEDPAYRREAGAAGRAFVERVHDPSVVAGRVLEGLT
jgi:glycosyltransferase involved in cell wall biosynthesis